MIKYWYYNSELNAGDYYNEYLIKKIYKDTQFCCSNQDIVMCGSIIEWPVISKSKYICGCGSQENNCPSNKNKSAYLAVRGYKTKELLVRSGILSEGDSKKLVLCDPGLLISMFLYDITIKKTEKIGIIPHFVDEGEFRRIYGQDNRFEIISMQTNDIPEIAKKIQECDFIISSSLHGIIFSHSLGLHAYYCSNKKLAGQQGFKFDDYYSSLGLECHHFVCKNGEIPIEEILKFNNDFGKDANPTRDIIISKQKEYINILPFRDEMCEEFIKKCTNNFYEQHIREIKSNFKTHDINKTYCVLGVLDNKDGKKIADYIVSKFSAKYDIISILHDGSEFEYPAIKYAMYFSKTNNCPVLYLHTKGAANPSAFQTKVINMWIDEFINHYDYYVNEVNRKIPTVVCPYSNEANATYFNGFIFNCEVPIAYGEIPNTNNRWFYECMFENNKKNAVVARINKNIPHHNASSLITEINNNYKSIDIDSYKMIIVTLTTWAKRICNIPHIIDLLLLNTKKPDKIVLNLSIEDFPNKEADFPDEMKNKLSEVSILEVNWVKNNTKVWKKLIPTLVKYPDDIVISIDDDFEYPNDLIETLYNDYVKNGRQHPISGNRERVCGANAHCGCASLTSYAFLNSKSQFKYLTEDIVSMGSDDVLYTWCAKINGTEYIPSSKLFFNNLKSFNAVSPYSKENNVDNLIVKEYKQLEYNYKNNKTSNFIDYICGTSDIIVSNSNSLQMTEQKTNKEKTNDSYKSNSIISKNRTIPNPPRPHSALFKNLYKTM